MHAHTPAPIWHRIVTLIGVVVPTLALIAGIWLAWGGWCSTTDLVMLGVGYVLTALGVTIGYHRLFTHRAFEASPVVAWFFGILGSMSVQGPLLWWAATHRQHHQHSDDEHDPHSPHAGHAQGLLGAIRGFWHAHVGWLCTRDLRSQTERYVPDLMADPIARRIDRLFPLWVALGLVIPALIGGVIAGTWTGAALGLLWGGLVRIFLMHHATWSINSVCHLWGWRDFESGDESRNNPIMGIVSMGEGWHNNHHAFPASARHGFGLQLDVSWIIIRALSWVGLTRRLRLPDPARMEQKRLRSAATA
ncbi:MAG: fatty acid desaturase [Phycisphaeraceae bacterium]|nr:fatty acid desaturase [Phycisphaeraceae bacterium]